MKSDMELKLSAAKQCQDAKMKSKSYRHFDHKLSLKGRQRLLHRFDPDKQCHHDKGTVCKYEKTFLNPTYVASYRQLPFIQFNINFQKYNSKSKDGKLKTKTRSISLSSHHEALLFKFYAIMLGQRYEEYIVRNEIDSVPMAYREKHDNVSAAKEVLDFIWQQNTWIIKGDFHAFFDCLNHQVLTRHVKTVLYGSENERLPADWMAVIKAITKYRIVSKKEIDKICGFRKRDEPYVSSLKHLEKMVRQGKIHPSQINKKGIPQGTAISAILANVYMIRFDKEVKELVDLYGGIYKRYSDDFVIVLPKTNCDWNMVKTIKDRVIAKSRQQLHLKINEKKTQILDFNKHSGHIYDVEQQKIRNFNYLGFEFTGKTVYLRSGTIYRFHYRGKKAVALLVRNIEERKVIAKGVTEEYLARRPTSQQYQRAFNRLVSASKDANKGYSIRGRKKITQMYLVMQPLRKKNMFYYADRAERIMKRPIIGITDMYQVKILKGVRDEIAGFQTDFGRIRKLKLCRYGDSRAETGRPPLLKP